MEVLHCPQRREVQAWAGTLPQATWIARLLTAGDALVLKPDGSPLLWVLRARVQGALYAQTYAAVAPLARSAPKHNRGLAAGKIRPTEDRAVMKGGVARGGQVGVKSAVRYRPIKQDGTLSKTVYAKDTPSFVMGYADRSARFPYCRQTAYTAKYPDRTAAVLPCLQLLDTLFATALPDRHAAQQAVCARTDPAFRFPGTTFTTITVNKNFQTALHQDAGDLAAGFGVMLCLRAGTYTGGHYVLPGFGIGVDLHACDVVLSDVHEWHGNTPLVGDPTRYERLTLVCYYRAQMVRCRAPAEELARVKRVASRRSHVSG